MGIGFASIFVTAFNAEVAPAHLRGLLIGLFHTGISIGALIGACIDQATHTMSTRLAYRIPLATQLFFPIIVAVFVWFFPDTPRTRIPSVN